MPLAQLTAGGREVLEQAAWHSAETREARRALALLDLAGGPTPHQVAARYRVGRPTVYDRAARWKDPGRPKDRRLRGAERSDRPPDARGEGAEKLAELPPALCAVRAAGNWTPAPKRLRIAGLVRLPAILSFSATFCTSAQRECIGIEPTASVVHTRHRF